MICLVELLNRVYSNYLMPEEPSNLTVEVVLGDQPTMLFSVNRIENHVVSVTDSSGWAVSIDRDSQITVAGVRLNKGLNRSITCITLHRRE